MSGMTKTDLQRNTIEIAKSVDKVRAVCAAFQEEMSKVKPKPTSQIAVKLGVDLQTFNAICYALHAAGVPIWPRDLPPKNP
jgi:hypothetical protein